jgi:hypothetical protein
VVAPLEMKEGTTSLGARAQSAVQRAAVLYKPRLATFNFNLQSSRNNSDVTAAQKIISARNMLREFGRIWDKTHVTMISYIRNIFRALKIK